MKQFRIVLPFWLKHKYINCVILNVLNSVVLLSDTDGDDLKDQLDYQGRGRESFLTTSMSMILFLISGSPPGLARLSALSLSLCSSLGPVIMIAAAPVIGQ